MTVLDLTAVPTPVRGELTIYVLGPGFGESQVLSMPDGRWVVVDCCRDEGRCLPLDLLEHLEASRVDLLVITHPDLDHINGMAALLDGSVPVKRIWRYPGGAHVHDFLVRWCRGRRGDGRFDELFQAIQRLERWSDENDAFTVCYGYGSWPPGRRAGYRIHCIAPVPRDVRRVSQELQDLVEWKRGRPGLAGRLERYLVGERASWRGSPNALSLGLVVEWKDTRVLLAGDIEKGDGSGRSGWPGIHAVLEQDGRLDLVRGLAVVKVAHHGSRGAFDVQMWKQHAHGAQVGAAVLTPFERGHRRWRPPHREALRGIGRHADNLAISAVTRRHRDQARAAGWTLVREGAHPGPACITLRIAVPGGSPDIHCIGAARRFRH
jgi:hypothetical protein